MIASLKIKERKLLDLYYADKIDQDGFAKESMRLTTQRLALQAELDAVELAELHNMQALSTFDELSAVLNELNLDEFWEEASPAERRILIDDLVDSVNIFPDRLTVQVAGAPPFLVTLQEVGLNQGCKPVVSARHEPALSIQRLVLKHGVKNLWLPGPNSLSLEIRFLMLRRTSLQVR